MRITIFLLLLASNLAGFSQKKFDFDTTVLSGKEQMIYLERYLHINSANDKFIIGSFKGACTIENTTITTNSNLPSDMCRGIYMVKYDSLNNFKWLRKICESDSIVTFYSVIDKSGNVLLALLYRTTLYKFNDTVFNINKLGDIMILKIDSSGSEIFTKKIDNPCFETITDIATDEDNNIFFSGLLDHDLNNCVSYFDSIMILNDTLAYLAKMDSAGNYEWIRKYNVGVIDKLCISEGNIYCLGSCNASDNNLGGIAFTYYPTYHSRRFVAKIDISGNGIWVKRFGSLYNGGVGFVIPQAITVREDRVCFSGTGNNQNQNIFLFDGAPTLNGIGLGLDVFLASYDTSGNFKWNAMLTGQNIENLTQLTLDSNLNVIGAGNIGSGGLTDAGVCSYDFNGNFNWKVAGGGFNTDVGSGISLDNHGKIYIVGGTTSSGGCVMGNDTLYPPANQSTMFFASMDSIPAIWPLSSNEIRGTSAEFVVYPNPASTFLNIEISNLKSHASYQDYNVQLFNALGKVLYSSQISNRSSHISVDISSFADGIYFLSYKTDQQSINKKIIIQH